MCGDALAVSLFPCLQDNKWGSDGCNFEIRNRTPRNVCKTTGGELSMIRITLMAYRRSILRRPWMEVRK